ncbi:MAG: hypothetical protein JXQ73_29275 [Phycisphaerae bacterium]|nr:hypothetical protein [Phycisphaerae bacterium]
MSGNRRMILLALATLILCLGPLGCRNPDNDVTYNPFVENRGRPTIGKRVEGVPNRMMERINQIDSRIENKLY